MKKLLLGLSILLVIATGVYFYLRHNKLRDFEPQIKERLNQLVEQASRGLYHLDIETLDTDVLNGKIVLTNAHLRPDTAVYAKMEREQQAPNDLFEVRVKQLLLDHVDAATFLHNKEVVVGR